MPWRYSFLAFFFLQVLIKSLSLSLPRHCMASFREICCSWLPCKASSLDREFSTFLSSLSSPVNPFLLYPLPSFPTQTHREVRRVSTVLQVLHSLRHHFGYSPELSTQQRPSSASNHNSAPLLKDRQLVALVRSHLLSFLRHLLSGISLFSFSLYSFSSLSTISSSLKRAFWTTSCKPCSTTFTAREYSPPPLSLFLPSYNSFSPISYSTHC